MACVTLRPSMDAPTGLLTRFSQRCQPQLADGLVGIDGPPLVAARHHTHILLQPNRWRYDSGLQSFKSSGLGPCGRKSNLKSPSQPISLGWGFSAIADLTCSQEMLWQVPRWSSMRREQVAKS